MSPNIRVEPLVGRVSRFEEITPIWSKPPDVFPAKAGIQDNRRTPGQVWTLTRE
jgi:hypothetical protein